MISPLISTLVLVLIGTGVAFRRRPSVHWPLMLTAFALDLGLVVYLEVSRRAVETAATSIHPLVWFHAAISLSVLFLWCVMLRLGWRMLRAGARVQSTHRRVAVVFATFRLLNYGTSLLIPTHREPAAVAAAPADAMARR